MTKGKKPSRVVVQIEPITRARKEPRQARSRALVEALVDGARRILDTDGRAELTVQRLSEVAGVAASSIYEYFPTMDGLVAAIFDRDRQGVRSRLVAAVRALPDEARLYDAVLMIVAEAARMRRDEIARDPSVGVHRMQSDELGRLELLDLVQPEKSVLLGEMAKRFPGEIVSTDMGMLQFLCDHLLQSMIRAMALERPELLGDPAAIELCARAVHGLIARPAPPPT